MQAVVLAGGAIPPALSAIADADERALIRVGEKTALDHVITSLQSVPTISEIICVTTPKALATLPDGVRGLPSGDKLSENLFKGLHATTDERVLVVTGDVPLATGRTWMQFLDGAAINMLEIAYPIVAHETMEAQYPGGVRTYAQLKEGRFTGGNAFLVPRARMQALESLIERAFAVRKNPIALARMLGMGFIWKAVTKKLTINEAEKRVSDLIGSRAGAVIVPDASIAFDIDKPVDLELARRLMPTRTVLPAVDDCGPTPLTPISS